RLPMQWVSRREFLQTTAAAAAGLTILTPSARAAAPSDRIRTAHIGVGGMGRGDLMAVGRQPNVHVVALCDVDSKNLDAAASSFTDARTFSDYRVMFEQMAGQIDAVVVSTPDHTHAPAAMTA